MSESFKPPIAFQHVLDEPGLVRRLVEENGPYSPVQRYFQNAAEYRALSGSDAQQMIVAPNFRGDFAYDQPLVPGVEPILYHEGFRAAAAELFDAKVVVPFSVYANITWQLPFDQGGGHTDVPEFRGFDRTRYPTTLLSLMGHSRLFEDYRISIATAVAWYYEGADGGFMYWPDGPDRPPRVHEGRIFNTALEADNERMFHRVRPVGRRSDGMLTRLTLEARLVHQGGDDWEIVDCGHTLAELRWPALRISLSWKARVYADEQARRVHLERRDELGLDEVVARFRADLDRRGVAHAPPQDPVREPAWLDLLSATYMRAPSVFEPVAA
jgi:hypothetical protein